MVWSFIALGAVAIAAIGILAEEARRWKRNAASWQARANEAFDRYLKEAETVQRHTALIAHQREVIDRLSKAQPEPRVYLNGVPRGRWVED